jgi:copper(I)-binding protein
MLSPAVATMAAQRSVRTTDGWVRVGATAEAMAGAVVENGTMYDIYLVGAETDAAGTVELVQTSGGKASATKEVLVAAFDRLEMSPTGTFLKLTQLKRALKSGDQITLVLQTDGGERLTVPATVK